MTFMGENGICSFTKNLFSPGSELHSMLLSVFTPHSESAHTPLLKMTKVTCKQKKRIQITGQSSSIEEFIVASKRFGPKNKGLSSRGGPRTC